MKRILLILCGALVNLTCAQFFSQLPQNYGPLGFVQVNGTRFTRNGLPYYIVGANYWQGMNLASDDSWGGNRTRLESELTELKNIGINNLRIMASSEGPDDQPFRMRPSLMPSPGVYNEHILAGLDFLLDAMGRHSMTAVGG
jgi:mannan endo-1,4-beta-mannosidase